LSPKKADFYFKVTKSKKAIGYSLNQETLKEISLLSGATIHTAFNDNTAITQLIPDSIFVTILLIAPEILFSLYSLAKIKHKGKLSWIIFLGNFSSGPRPSVF
jgi:hypothetical protein